MSRRPWAMLQHLIQVPPLTLFSWKQGYVHFRVGEFLSPLKDSELHQENRGESEHKWRWHTAEAVSAPSKFSEQVRPQGWLGRLLALWTVAGQKRGKAEAGDVCTYRRQGVETSWWRWMLCGVAIGGTTLTAFWPHLREVSLAWRPAASCCACRPRSWPCPSR
jgi:hypothetical protein